MSRKTATPGVPPVPTEGTVPPVADAAEAAAAAAAKEAAKEAAKVERERVAAEKAAAKVAEKAAKAEAAAAAKQAKLDEKAAAKARNEAIREANRQPEQNGVRRPKPDTLCGRAWTIFDTVSNKNGAPASIGESMALAKGESLNESNVRAEYARWRKFNGISGRVAAPKPEVPPAPPAPAE